MNSNQNKTDKIIKLNLLRIFISWGASGNLAYSGLNAITKNFTDVDFSTVKKYLYRLSNFW